MLDPSIITNGTLAAQAQQEANMKAMGDLGGAFGKLLLARQINDMNQMATPEEEKAFAQKHKLFAPQLMQQYNDNRAAEAKAIKDGLKFDADLNKTYADTAQTYALGRKNDADAGKATAEGKKVGVETTGLDIDQNTKLDTMIWGSVLNGGKNAGIAQLEIQKSRGLIDEATYNQKLGLINNLPADPAQAQKYAFAMYKGIQDPKYNLTTADNALDNQTSRQNTIDTNQTSERNNVRTTQASMYSSDRSLEGTKYTANQATYRTEKEIEAAKKQGKQQLINGLVYTVYPDGTADEFIDPKTGQQATSLGNGIGNKPMPASALNLISTSRDKIQSSQNTIDKIEQSIKDLDPKQGGKLSLGLLGNAGNVARNLTGNSNESSLAYERLNSNIKGMVNEVLQMAKGTQTEGDAQRAAKVILSTPLTDNRAVSNALAELKRVAQKTVALEQGKVEEVYSNYGKEAPIYPAASAPPAGIAAPKTPSGKPRPPLSAYGF
nr:hypothetical protein [Moraxella sp. CTOTU47616]